MQVLGSKAQGARLERMKASPRFKDGTLIMPRLGQPIEPHHVQSIDPWWREVEETETEPAPMEALAQPID